jgi:D-alanyl-D-alanine carboxypeptidase
MKLQYLKVLLTILIMFSSTIYAKPINFESQLKPILQQYLQDNAQSEHISAISVNINSSHGINQSIAIGSSSRERDTHDVTPKSLFQIGSITKSFTAAIILRLQDQGKLNINDKVTKFFPEYKEWGKISIKQLLNMTAG